MSQLIAVLLINELAYCSLLDLQLINVPAHSRLTRVIIHKRASLFQFNNTCWAVAGLGFGMSGDSTCGGGGGGGDDAEKIYSPKRNKKIVRIVTVLGYIFSVSTGKSPPIAELNKLICLEESSTVKPVTHLLGNTTFSCLTDWWTFDTVFCQVPTW